MKRVLSTRILSDETIAHGLSLNLEIQCRDFIDITEIPFDDTILLKGDFDSMAFTSSYAVKALVKNEVYKDLLKKKNIFSLSGRTADALAKAGLKAIVVADDAASLADKIIEMGLTKSILHPGGNLTLERLNLKMNKANIAYHPLAVYQTTLNNLKLENSSEYDAVMFYSPSGLKSFFHSNKLAVQTIVCCIGETTAKALRELQSHNSIIIPAVPSPEGMIEAIGNHFKKSSAEA